MSAPAAAPLETYLAHLARGELAFQRAPDGTAVFFPRLVAPRSGATDLQWQISAGLGTVYSATTLHPKGEPAYNVSLIDVDEGFRLMSRVEGVDPAAVKIGMRVRVRITHDAAGTPLPVFDALNAEQNS
ncbi:Zn-ribbon domain-containing OB-fold protein [Rhodopseudomonas palustris]|uniref:ChsH2 C-terminal OB-fold domain-containing protein n=1 Tax=Rhodopseudomonas palustris (strain BisB18) TaxID=316056 RepID=Q21AE9_RHOPB